jgi:hypothetical protein
VTTVVAAAGTTAAALGARGGGGGGSAHFATTLLCPGSADISRGWVVDSGASVHMTGDRSVLDNFMPCRLPKPVVLADGNSKQICGVGTSVITAASGAQVKLWGVCYVPGLQFNLLSVARMTLKGATVSMSSEGCTISKDGVDVVAQQTGGLFVVPRGCSEAAAVWAAGRRPAAAFYSSASAETPELVHRRMAHPSYEALARMAAAGSVSGLGVTAGQFRQHQPDQCGPCIQGRLAQAPFARSSSRSRPLELVHSDICGPIDPESAGGSRYMISLVDDSSGYGEVGLLRRKSDGIDWVKDTMMRWQRSKGGQIIRFRSDQGAEYQSREFQGFLRQQGIVQEQSAVYTPQQNGVAEQFNRSVLERMRSMLADSELSQRFWAEAAHTAAYLRNRTTQRQQQRTPFELFWGKKPNIQHLRVWGSSAFVRVPPALRVSKLDPVCWVGFMMGYSTVTKGWKVWVPSLRRFVTSRDVVFDESSKQGAQGPGSSGGMPARAQATAAA